MTKTEFLNLNPEIRKYMKNDTSLKNICTVTELQSLDIKNLERKELCDKSEYDYKFLAYTIENYQKLILQMIINGKHKYTIKYTKDRYSKEELNTMIKNLKEAYQRMSMKYIGYFNVISSLDIKYTYSYLKGHKQEGLTDIEITVILKENYKGAIKDIDKYIRLCNYIVKKLKENGKIRDDMSQLEIARVLYNWVVLHVQYDWTLEKSSQTGLRGLIEGICVCNGFTSIYNTLCTLCNIEAYAIRGTAGKNIRSAEPHIWTYLVIDGKKHFIDVTWGNVEYGIKDKEKRENFESLLLKYKIDKMAFCDFTYFDMSKYKMKSEHFWNNTEYKL